MANPTLKEPVYCPKCGEKLSFELTSQLMDSSRVSFSLEPHKGELLSAATVGKALAALDGLYGAVAKEIGAKVTTNIENITFSEGGVKFDLLLTRHEPGIKKRKAA